MTSPFFRVSIRHNRDLLLVRQKARQLSHLLQFDPNEEACIAAGTFAVGLQAKAHLCECEICFSIENRQLFVHARSKNSENLASSAVANADKQVLKLRKPIPEHTILPSLDDLAWMLGQVDQQSPPRLFEEVVRQNQEILMLLHERQLNRSKGEPSGPHVTNPTAA